MGPTKLAKALEEAPFSIRARYGISDTENAVHGSGKCEYKRNISHLCHRVSVSFTDSPESARREIRLIFPEFQMESWYETEEPLFRAGNIKFDTNFVVHKVTPQVQSVC